MKNGVLDISVFELLDSIKKQHNISDTEWAVNSGLKYSSRISEIRKMLELQKNGESPSSVGRAFSIKKCTGLFTGLQNILGEHQVTKEMLALLEKSEDRRQRIIILVLLLKEEHETTVEMFLRSTLQIEKEKAI